MNIQNIKVVDKDTIIVTTIDGKTILFEKNKLEGAHRSWFDNILSSALSLTKETSQK